MKDFIEKIRKVYPLSDEALSLFIAETERVSFPKGHLLIRSDVKEKYSYFIIKGYARGFFYKEDRDVTIWFASSGMSLLSMNGYMFGSAGYENIELANWGRRMSDQIILELEKLIMERCFISASERYHLLMEQEPEILQKVPLRHIASYLGISQVSLSRIRAGIQ